MREELSYKKWESKRTYRFDNDFHRLRYEQDEGTLLLLLLLMMMMMIVIFVEECPRSVILMTYGSDEKQHIAAWHRSQVQVYEAGK
jgi:hypothetical protein